MVFALNTFLYLLLNAYIRLNLLKPDLAASVDPNAVIKGLIGPLSYLVGAALAWVNIYAAFAVYALTPLFYITPWAEHAPPRGTAPVKSKRKR
jgi:hypothetical protein